MHGGVQLTLGLIRQRFWIPRGRVIVKKFIHRCVTCTRWRAAATSDVQPSLGTSDSCPPFQRIGVDFAGPISTKGRGHRAPRVSSWFSCASASEQSTSRQTTRRGHSWPPSVVSSLVEASVKKSFRTAAPISSGLVESSENYSGFRHPTAAGSLTLQRE